MKLKRRFLYLILVFVLITGLFGNNAFSAEDTATGSDAIIQERLAGAVVIYSGSMYAFADNNLKVIDPANDLITPFIQNNRMLVPVRFIAESLGAAVSWEQSTSTVTIAYEEKVVKIKIYSTEMLASGKTVKLDVPAMITGDRTFIPIRALTEALGKMVFYDRGLVIISDKADIFNTVTEKNLIDILIGELNILPVVGTREKLVSLLSKAETAVPVQKATDSTSSAAEDQGASTAGNRDYSETNIQVAGVDEGDIVKTDGNYIYQISDQKIQIFKAYPAAEMALINSISFAEVQFTPLELYIKGDKLIIAGSDYNIPSTETDPAMKVQSLYPYYNYSSLRVLVYNIADKSKPTIIREVSLHGNYVSSRLIENNLYLVSNQYIYNWSDTTVPLNPRYKDSAAGTETILVPYDAIRYLPPVTSQSYLMVAGLSLDDMSKPLSVETYLGAGEKIYVSQSNLYVSVNEGYWGIRPMRLTEAGFIAPQSQEATLIYKFMLKDAKASFQSRGQVPGRILNQFSMDENKGYFRIATTLGNSWMSEADALSNNVYILDNTMNITGRLEKLAIGEKIYSVRFMGDRAYVVTFRTVDPLFVINLADVWNPSVLGTLKIPGYSDYLHPYDENHLIGFGKDTIAVPVKDSLGNVISTNVFYLGMKVALFDVSDVAKPVVKFSVKIGDRGTDSELLNDHKALLFDKDKQLLAFPVNETKLDGPVLDPVSGYPDYGSIVFNGAYIYKLNLTEGFILKGKITHLTADDYLKSGYYSVDYNKQIRRILYIDSVLYGISNSEISAHDMSSLLELNSISEN